MTFGLRYSQPACRPHPASLPVRIPTVESLLRASFDFASRLRLAFRYGCRHRLRLAPFIQRDSAHAGHTGAGPRPAAASQAASEGGPDGVRSAAQGAAPQEFTCILRDLQKRAQKLSGIGLKPAPPVRARGGIQRLVPWASPLLVPEGQRRGGSGEKYPISAISERLERSKRRVSASPGRASSL